MSSDKFIHEAVGGRFRLEPCAPFNSGVDIDGDAQVQWDAGSRSVTIWTDTKRTIISGATYDALEVLKGHVSAHWFGSDLLLCVPKFKDIKREACYCNFANYGFLYKGRIRLDKMALNLADPSDWELDILDMLSSHGNDKLIGKFIGERWGVFEERCNEILELPFFQAVFGRLSSAPMRDTLLVTKIRSDIRKLLVGELVLPRKGVNRLGLFDLVKIFICTRLHDPVVQLPDSLWISALCVIALAGKRWEIYESACICTSSKIDAIPRRDTCKLAVLPNSVMLLGEINATIKQKDLLSIVAEPYDIVCEEKGDHVLADAYEQLKGPGLMHEYYNRFGFKLAGRETAVDVVRKASEVDFEPFVAWWQDAVDVEQKDHTRSGGSVQVPMGDTWSGADVLDCFTLGVLAGSARLAEYLTIEVRMALLMGIEKKMLDQVTFRCAWHGRGRLEEKEKKRIAYMDNVLKEISGEAIVRPEPVQVDDVLRNTIRERTRSVTERYVLLQWPRPKPIALILFFAFAAMCLQLVFDKQERDNVFSVTTRAITNFLVTSIVFTALIIGLEDWTPYDMWRGQRKVIDISLVAKNLRKTYAEVVLSLRQSGIWNRAISDTNACVILKGKKQEGGVIMKRGLYVQELRDNNFLLPCDTATLLLPHNGEGLDLYSTAGEGTYHYSESISGPVMTSYCANHRLDDVVGADISFLLEP